MNIKLLALFAASLSGAMASLGINCRGSSNCGTSPNSMMEVYSAVQGVNQATLFTNGEKIACAGNLCAFFQMGASGYAQEASELIQDLINHGCTKCGSAPTQGNNVSQGELTVNYVSNTSK